MYCLTNNYKVRTPVNTFPKHNTPRLQKLSVQEDFMLLWSGSLKLGTDFNCWKTRIMSGVEAHTCNPCT
ncbi:hypothetical protein I79_020026 [Cricetulus griseus]|uniref:Uncharacterized protein n=1 Tax=Cricetulus griseus TaxID=10029 RepID=G3I8Z4_CRIGR|nr:hypothetical protein I79_020026 [Cricetulus griseus]